MLIAVLFSQIIFIVAATVSSVAGDLSVSIDGPSDVSDIENLILSVTVRNSGDRSLKLLNDPRGPLSVVPADTFIISHTSGMRPAFAGVKVKYVKETVIERDKQVSFTVLNPGEHFTVAHDISEAYNFTESGPGLYTFSISGRFHQVDQGTNLAVPIHAIVRGHQVTLSGKLSKSRPPRPLLRRATFSGCNSAQQDAVRAAASYAQGYAAEALRYLELHASASPRYNTWFGNVTDTLREAVFSHFTHMNEGRYSEFSYDCTCGYPDSYAFVSPKEYGHIHLCPSFWEAPLTGTNSKAGTLIHESSHFTVNGDTEDYVYGQEACMELAMDSPVAAVENADSHEFFAENTPVLL